MTIKEYLSQTFTLNKLINAKKAYILQLHDMHKTISDGICTDENVRTNPSNNYINDIISQIKSAEDDCHEKIFKMISLQRNIASIIDNIDLPDSRLILFERYINMKLWEDIAEESHYSLKWVYVLHKRGITAIEPILKNNTDNDVMSC